nr:DUF3592 domain-containing protein [Pseudoclavibacter chungangensis]
MGAVLCLACVLLLMRLGTVARRRRHWPRAVATVRRLRERSDSDGTRTTVVYRFEDADGNRHLRTSLVLVRAPRPGSTMPVVYNPDEPSEHEIVSRAANIGTVLAAVATGAGGVGLFVVGITGGLG